MKGVGAGRILLLGAADALKRVLNVDLEQPTARAAPVNGGFRVGDELLARVGVVLAEAWW